MLTANTANPPSLGVRVEYLHSEIDTLQRWAHPLRNLRKGEFDVLVGVNPCARGSTSGGVARWPSLDGQRRGICARPALSSRPARAARKRQRQSP